MRRIDTCRSGRRGRGRTHETGEGKFAEQEVGGALVAADFFQRERAGLVAVRSARAGERVAGCECLLTVAGMSTGGVGIEGRVFRAFLLGCDAWEARELTLNVAISCPSSSASFAARFADCFPRRGSGLGTAATSS